MKRNRKFFSILLFACLITLLFSTVYAAIISLTSINEDINIDSIDLNATHEYVSTSGSFDLEFTKKADTKNIKVDITNSTDVVLDRYYTINLKKNTKLSSLASAILVYLNGEYINTLSSILADPSLKIKVDNSYIFKQGGKKTDIFSFELHQSAIDSPIDKKSLSIVLNTYTDTVNYEKNMYVTTKTELEKAIDDVNTGLIDNPQIILGQSLTLTDEKYEVTNPFTLVLNSYNLSSGEFVLNDTDAYIEIIGDSSFSSTITKTSYSVEKVENLIAKQIINSSKEIQSNTETDILGNYSAYAPVVGTSFGTINSTKLSVGGVSYTKSGVITLKLGENERKISFNVIGNANQLIDNTLKHIPNNSNKDVTTDLFLPTSIPNQNASITWTSSDTSVMDNEGHIVIDYVNSKEITLYAKIQINDNIYSKSYSFKVSVHNDEINFYKLVSEISPLVIQNIYNGDNGDDALYYLPIVTSYDSTNSKFGNYDYRTDYETPTTQKLYKWYKNKDIGLKSISYSMTQEQQEKYEYISIVNNNGIGLNRSTLNTYACITITGEYEGKSYTSEVNISIAVGSNTQLLEQAFSSLNEEFNEINVLKNIIETRNKNGLHLESGDFYLSSVYNEDYKFTYTIPEASNKIITSIILDEGNNKYLVKLNPLNFNSSVTNVSIIAKVRYGSIESERTFYFSVPAALHTSDLGTISIFNSIQYQVFQSLPTSEQSGTTGFEINNNQLKNSNYDYILMRDIVGDEEYSLNYESSDYLTKLNYTSEKYAPGVKDLYFYTNKETNTNSTDYNAYEFMRLIQWATMNDGKKIIANSIVSDNNSLGSYASIYSNGKDFINDDEMNVIKSYYMYYTNCDDSTWNSVYNQSFDRAPGYIYDNQKLLNVIFEILNETITGKNWYNGNTQETFGTIYGKYVEIVNRYATSIADKSEYAPCQEVYNYRYAWFEYNDDKKGTSINYQYCDKDKPTLKTATATILYSVKTHNGKYWNCFNHSYSNGSDGQIAGIYANSNYQRDHTMYITEAELTVLKIFWLNAAMASGQNTQEKIANYEDKALDTTKITDDILSGYIGYTREDFDTVAEAIVNGFNACLTIPTNFTNDGVSKLIDSFYKNYNNSGYQLNVVGSSNSFNSIIVNAYVANNLSTYKSANSIKVPYVTNLDTLKGSLAYFSNLENLYIYGNNTLFSFLGENELSIFITRTGHNNLKLKTLALEYILVPSNTFNLSNLNNYQQLEYIDLSHNMSIVSTNELVNTKRDKYKFVDISYINAEYEYIEFAIDNIAKSGDNTTIVYFLNENGTLASTNVGDSSVLSNLKDFDSFITDLLLLNNIESEGSTKNETTRIVWRIEQGNPIDGGINNGCYINGGQYPECTTPDEIIRIISPYYYCIENFTYSFKNVVFTFTKDHTYKLYFNSEGLVGYADLGAYDIIESEESLPEHTDDHDTSSHVAFNANKTIDDISLKSSNTTVDTITLCENPTTKTVNGKFNTYYLSVTRRGRTYYLASDTNSTNLTTVSGNSTDACYFSFLTEDEAIKLCSDLCNDSTFGQTNIDITGNTTAYYLYFPNAGKFVGSSKGNTGDSISIHDSYHDACPYYVY